MKFNQQVPQADFRAAYDALMNGIKGWDGSMIQAPKDNITAEAKMIQEQAFLATNNAYVFDFGTNAPLPSATLGNVVLGQNNSFVMCGIQILMGFGANQVNRQYLTRGFTSSDNSLYNAQLSMNLESNQPIQKVDMIEFYEEGDFIGMSGYVPIKPLRAFTGLLARLQVNINFLNPISALTITPNLFISVRLCGAMGLA